MYSEFESGTFGRGVPSYLDKMFKAIGEEKKFVSNLVIKFDVAGAEEFGGYTENEQHHDAGYDSYMTGYIFAMMAKRMEIENLLTSAALKKMDQEKAEEEKKQAEADATI